MLKLVFQMELCTMKKPWLVLLGAVVLCEVLGSNGCFKEEKDALLDFKATYANELESSLRRSWMDDNPKSNCCEWERVTCDSSSGRIIHLNLRNLFSYHEGLGCLILNHTRNLNWFFFPIFRELTSLDLSHNCFDGSIRSEGICKMKQLQVLDLSFNNFRGPLDTCFDNFTSLRSLDLSHNFLNGNPAPSIVHLASLEYLSIYSNEFEGLFSFNILTNHSRLKELHIGDVNSKTLQVETENPPWVAPFQLERLRISSCGLNFPTKVIPTFLLNQSALIYMDLSGNNLVGKFPSWLLMNNPNLEEVYLSDNSFTGPFELSFDLNHHMDQMEFFQISNNQFQGKLPNNIGYFFPNLRHFDVLHNMFDGHIPASIGEMPRLERLHLGNNSFSNKIPEHIINGCLSLHALMMDNNQLHGTLLNVIRKLRQLTILTASRNNFEGEITSEWCQHKFSTLDLSYNNFFGVLPSCFKVPHFLYLQGNGFTGMIPEALISIDSYSRNIDLSDNKFTGTIPDSIYKFRSLTRLLLAGNQFQGQLSSQICQLNKINILDFSRNNFTGSIPSCFNNISFGNVTTPSYYFDRNQPIHPKSNYAEVQVMAKNSYLSYKSDERQNMSVLDLSCNQLTGKIPHQIGDLHYLNALNLSHNHLNGPIPESFQKLEKIESLDLSDNNLSGQIPLQLQDLHSLAVFNVCYNNLSGKAPDKGQFGTFDENSYKGNPYLTWNISNRGHPIPPTLLHDGEGKESAIDFTAFYWTFSSSYVMVLIVFVTILWINPHWRGKWFYFVHVCLDKCFGQFLEDVFY